MGAADTVAGLAGFEGRGAGTDTERRAALWLSRELSTGRREATLETFWSRPNWALAHAWHTALALAGSLVSVASPKVGGALILIALLSLAVDALTGVSLGRRLTFERASQNVVSPPPVESGGVRLVVTANYDAGRMGLVHRPALRVTAARLRAAAGPLALGWEAWLAISFAWLLVTAILRDGGTTSQALAVAQLVPTAALVLTLALLLELASAQFGPGAGDNASGVGVALALARALDVSAPRNVGVEVVLQGASDGSMTGLGRHLRPRRRERAAANTIILGIGACGAGKPCFWTSDGTMLPLRLHPRLAGIVAAAVGPGTELGARPHRGRGVSPAFPGRQAGLPAITIGSLDERGLVPRSHLPTDTVEALDRGALDRMLELALTVVDAIDADLQGAVSGRAASSPTAA
jgi:Peptidase family M28